jgi:hypothetical protein
VGLAALVVAGALVVPDSALDLVPFSVHLVGVGAGALGGDPLHLLGREAAGPAAASGDLRPRLSTADMYPHTTARLSLSSNDLTIRKLRQRNLRRAKS